MVPVPIRLFLALALAAPLPAAAQRFDHAAFDALLARHVDDAGMVDYAAFDTSTAFRGYLASLAAADPAALPREERLALCVFHVPVGGKLRPMCEVNATPLREEYYAELAARARREGGGP